MEIVTMYLGGRWYWRLVVALVITAIANVTTSAVLVEGLPHPHNGFHRMDFSPQILGPVIVALITATGSYIMILQKMRDELREPWRRSKRRQRRRRPTTAWLSERSKEPRCRSYVKRFSSARTIRLT